MKFYVKSLIFSDLTWNFIDFDTQQRYIVGPKSIAYIQGWISISDTVSADTVSNVFDAVSIQMRIDTLDIYVDTSIDTHIKRIDTPIRVSIRSRRPIFASIRVSTRNGATLGVSILYRKSIDTPLDTRISGKVYRYGIEPTLLQSSQIPPLKLCSLSVDSPLCSPFSPAQV